MICAFCGDYSRGRSDSVLRVQPGHVAGAGCPFVRVLINRSGSVT